MGSSLPISSLVDAKWTASANGDEYRPHCCCTRPTSDAQAIGRPVRGGVLTLLGMLGWLCVPKCPLCLATYVAIGSGVTLSFAQSQVLRQMMFVVAAGVLVAGTLRLGMHRRQFIRSRKTYRSCDEEIA